MPERGYLMSKAIEQIKEIGRNMERLAGKGARNRVMAGSESITAYTEPVKVAIWVKVAMEVMDKTVSRETRNEIMRACGANCAMHNKTPIVRAKARRGKFKSEKEFLAAEIAKPPAGTRLEKKGNVLYQYYTPASFTRPMRCYCSMLSKLPDDQTVSPTYCQCSRGFVEKFWEETLGRKVEVDVAETCVTGAKECKFVVRL
jgi:hypothetical protein